jgi:hypothetical protein
MVYSLAAVEKTASHLNFLFCYTVYSKAVLQKTKAAHEVLKKFMLHPFSSTC